MCQISETKETKAIAYNYSNLMDLYDVFKPKEIPLLLSRLRQYLLDGHKWYQKNVSNVSYDEISENMEFLDELKLTAEKMLIVQGNYISFGMKEKGFEVNLVPFNKFLIKKSLVVRMDEISYLQNKLRMFLHEHNITGFKEGAEFMEIFQYILSDIEEKDAFQYLQ